jgi:gluconolactonase
VRIPEMAANLHWGGEDFRTLFVCATHSVYTVPTKVGPRNEPFMRAAWTRPPASTPPASSSVEAPPAPERATEPAGRLRLDPARCALIIQDMQNDVVMDGGAFAASGSPQHCREQRCIENIRRLAEVCRARGVMLVHVWFLVEPGAPGVTLNAPLFEGLVDAKALVRGTWGAEPVPGLERRPGDLVVEKMRMSAFEGTSLETVLKSGGRDTIIVTGAWTNMSIEHTSRTGADKGYVVIVPEDCCSTMNADWHRASINYALTNVAAVTSADEVIGALDR